MIHGACLTVSVNDPLVRQGLKAPEVQAPEVLALSSIQAPEVLSLRGGALPNVPEVLSLPSNEARRRDDRTP